MIDLLVLAALFTYFINSQQSLAASATAVAIAATPPTATASPTPWPGPGPRPTATPTLPPTVLPTDVLADSGFPVGFTPTPRPTRPPAVISLPKIVFSGRNRVNVPVVNQIYYPEPFFPPGSNNACGPVALFAGLQGLGIDIKYNRLRDIAVRYGFNAEGISKSGLIGTAVTINNELGQPLEINYGNRFTTRSLIQQLGQGGVVVVLVRVKKVNGQFVVTSDYAGTFGHFLLVERINLRSKMVYFAGSTLGMNRVPLVDFMRAWTGNPNLPDTSSAGWRTYLKEEKAGKWALVVKRS
jgi:hypothetical protein